MPPGGEGARGSTDTAARCTIHRASLWSSCVVLPLLALTWMSAVLAVTDRRSALFQILFAVFDSLEGFVIVMVHCILRREVGLAGTPLPGPLRGRHLQRPCGQILGPGGRWRCSFRAPHFCKAGLPGRWLLSESASSRERPPTRPMLAPTGRAALSPGVCGTQSHRRRRWLSAPLRLLSRSTLGLSGREQERAVTHPCRLPRSSS